MHSLAGLTFTIFLNYVNSHIRARGMQHCSVQYWFFSRSFQIGLYQGKSSSQDSKESFISCTVPQVHLSLSLWSSLVFYALLTQMTQNPSFFFFFFWLSHVYLVYCILQIFCWQISLKCEPMLTPVSMLTILAIRILPFAMLLISAELGTL